MFSIIKYLEHIPNYIYILQGLVITISVSLGCFIFGMIFGIIFGLATYLSAMYHPWIHKICRFIQRFFINTPIISQVFIAYFVLSISNNLVFLSIMVLGVNSAAHMSVKVLEYLNNISNVYWETTYSLGFTPIVGFYRIFLKEMFYHCRQSFFGELVALVKESALLSFFGVKDICFRSKEVGVRIYNLAPYILFASLVYFTLIGTLEMIYNRYFSQKDKNLDKKTI